MKEMNVKISKDSGSLGKQIIQWMGYQEGWGLRKKLQGNPSPVTVKRKSTWTGIGYDLNLA
jgi:hypothetical protein